MTAQALYDEENGLVYVAVGVELWNQLRYGWSEPVQARVENQHTLVFRSLEQVGRLYRTDDLGRKDAA